MKTKTIKIKEKDLINVIDDKYVGSTEWNVYTNAKGNVSLRRGTDDNRGFYKIVDMYLLQELYDNEGRCKDDIDYNRVDVYKFVIDDMKCYKLTIEDNDDTNNTIIYEIKIV